MPPKARARDLGLPFGGRTGTNNAITDVAGLEVGYATLNRDLVEGGAVRTGVTLVLPRGRKGAMLNPVWAGFHSLNGNGEMTGMHWVREAGHFLGPVAITNTHSVGAVHQGVARLMARAQEGKGAYTWVLPVVAETCDAHLNDMNGFHVEERHVFEAFEAARPGAIAEGNVGGGTGMICYEFKGGTGTASRIVEAAGGSWTVGALVQANFGARPLMRVLGVPVGEHLRENRLRMTEQGSIIALVATDAPLMPTQLERLARRAGLGIARTGSCAGDGSGDLCLAFSTANEEAPGSRPATLAYLPNHALDPIVEAVAQAVEEAIWNAVVAAETMTGQGGRRVVALDHAQLREVMKAYGRLNG